MDVLHVDNFENFLRSDSGYVCMVFHKRDTNVIEIQQTSEFEENPDDACRKFNPVTTPFTSLVSEFLRRLRSET